MSEERNNNMKSKELKAILAGVAQALNTTLDKLNKDEQEAETFDNTDDLFESWEEPDLRRLAEDAYNEWLDSPAGYRHHTVSRKDCVDFWVAAFLAGNRSAPKESNTEMLANAEIEHKDKCIAALEQDFIDLVSDYDVLRTEFYSLISLTKRVIGEARAWDGIDQLENKINSAIVAHERARTNLKSL